MKYSEIKGKLLEIIYTLGVSMHDAKDIFAEMKNRNKEFHIADMKFVLTEKDKSLYTITDIFFSLYTIKAPTEKKKIERYILKKEYAYLNSIICNILRINHDFTKGFIPSSNNHTELKKLGLMHWFSPSYEKTKFVKGEWYGNTTGGRWLALESGLNAKCVGFNNWNYTKWISNNKMYNAPAWSKADSSKIAELLINYAKKNYPAGTKFLDAYYSKKVIAADEIFLYSKQSGVYAHTDSNTVSYFFNINTGEWAKKITEESSDKEITLSSGVKLTSEDIKQIAEYIKTISE